MKKYLLICSVVVLLSGACSVDVTQTSTALPSTKTEIPASTFTVVPSSTVTSTIAAPTSTLIPVTTAPAHPSYTPTFDVSTIVTVTPAEKTTCPIANHAENLNFEFLHLTPGVDLENRAHAEENILNFLNAYGAGLLLEHLRYHWGTEGRNFSYIDITNDDIQELAIGLTSFYIFSCKNGKYETIFEVPPDGYLRPPGIFSIKDNNRNGIPEITLLMGVASQGGHSYKVFEWNGNKFRSLVYPEEEEYPESGYIWLEATGKIFYQDIDHDLINELISDSGIPVWSTYVDGLPWRNERTIYEWNGKDYIQAKFEFSSPEFRFQAIQDGDLATKQGEFDKAQDLYQDAIFSDKLEDFSPEIRRNLQENWMSQIGPDHNPTPTPYPSDPTEYPRLAAYAYYRLMLLHLVRGYESDASTVFNTLQQKFQDDAAGHLYAEMVAAFMLKYQSTHEIALACDAAIQFAEKYPEILVPLGSDYHGWQSHTYKPEDICPFR